MRLEWMLERGLKAESSQVPPPAVGWKRYIETLPTLDFEVELVRKFPILARLFLCSEPQKRVLRSPVPPPTKRQKISAVATSPPATIEALKAAIAAPLSPKPRKDMDKLIELIEKISEKKQTARKQQQDLY